MFLEIKIRDGLLNRFEGGRLEFTDLDFGLPFDTGFHGSLLRLLSKVIRLSRQVFRDHLALFSSIGRKFDVESLKERGGNFGGPMTEFMHLKATSKPIKQTSAEQVQWPTNRMQLTV